MAFTSGQFVVATGAQSTQSITAAAAYALLSSQISASDISTGTLAAARGGTGVSNAGTLTNASNTTITGGGTVALGGFTLTVPATGTAALLATANTFTQAITVPAIAAQDSSLAINGLSATSGNTNGGAVVVTAGAGFGTGTGGGLDFYAGNSGANGIAGSVNIFAGNSAATNGDGGQTYISGGGGSGNGIGGAVDLIGGSPANGGNGSGGDVRVYAGDKQGSGTEGAVCIANPTNLLGFHGATPIAKQTGVPVTVEALHAAIVATGLIAA